MRRSHRVAMVALTVGAALVPLAFAGVARSVRGHRESDLEHERRLAADYRQQIDQAQRQLQTPAGPVAAQWRLLSGAEVAATLQHVQTVVDASGVTLTAAKAAPSADDGRQAYQLSGHGRPEQVCALLAGIERHPRLIVVESGCVTPHGEHEVDFELGLATYHTGGGR